MGNQCYSSRIIGDKDDHADDDDDDEFVVINYHKYPGHRSYVEDYLLSQYIHLVDNWKTQQYLLRKKITYCEEENFLENLRYIGGVDISFPNNDYIHGCACLVVMSYPNLEIVYKKCQMVHMKLTYIPTFLAFREIEHIATLCDELLHSHSQFYPQLIMVDGNGLLHPRKFGIACHLGVMLDIPTIGVAKKLFQVDGLQKNEIFQGKIKALSGRGDSFDLIGEDGYIYGRALRSTLQSTNPIYVSIGNKITLDTALKLIIDCCKYRIPEPIRYADQLSREYLRNFYEEHLENCSL